MKTFGKSAIAMAALLAFSAGAQAADVQSKGGISVKSDDGAFAGEFGGRLQADYAAFQNDGTIDQSNPGAFFRRLRLQGKGKMYNNWEGMIQLDFSNRTLDVKDAFLKYKAGTEALTREFVIGHYKQPMGLEELTSSNVITFMERSPAINAIAPNHRVGVGFAAAGGALTGAASVYGAGRLDANTTSAANNNEALNPTNGIGIGGRGTWTPIKDKINLLHLGVSGAYEDNVFNDDGFRDSDTSRWSTRNGERIRVATLAAGKYEIARGGLEAAYSYGSLSLQAEYLAAELKGKNGAASNFDALYHGGYAMASFFLTGENRPYKAATGLFDRVTPLNAGTGAWELTARYSIFQGDSDFSANANNPEEGKVQDITLGVNYYFNPQIRVMLNYVLADIETRRHTNFGGTPLEQGEPSAVMMRAQFDF